jgi:hypothetical protein
MPKMIELDEVRRLLGEDAQLLDVMSREARKASPSSTEAGRSSPTARTTNET